MNERDLQTWTGPTPAPARAKRLQKYTIRAATSSHTRAEFVTIAASSRRAAQRVADWVGAPGSGFVLARVDEAVLTHRHYNTQVLLRKFYPVIEEVR